MGSFDFAKVGRDLLASGKGIPTDYGLLFENETEPFTAVYSGETFPQYYYRADIIASVRLEYNGKSEYLYLPEESISIDKALARMGNPALEDCVAVERFINENGRAPKVKELDRVRVSSSPPCRGQAVWHDSWAVVGGELSGGQR